MRFFKSYSTLILLIVLTCLIIGIPAYQRIQERRRIARIHEVKHEAQKMDGISVAEAIERLKSLNGGRKLTIVYMGNTQGYLESCGCFEGQSGGVARRATFLKQLREKGIEPLVVDAGGIFSGNSPLDRFRTEVYLQSMNKMGYHASGLSAEELRFGESFLREQIASLNFPFLSVNLTDEAGKPLGRPYHFVQIGKFRIAIIGVAGASESGAKGRQSVQAAVPQSQSDIFVTQKNRMTTPSSVLRPLLQTLRGQADLILLFSSLSQSETQELAREIPGIDVIVCAYKGENEKIDSTRIVYSQPRGNTVGVLALAFDVTGHVTKDEAFHVELKEDVADHPEIRTLLSNFYNRVSTDADLQQHTKKLFSHFELEQSGRNAYIGSEECRSCHQQEFAQWAVTSHAVAFQSLLHVQRHFYSDCVVCHTTGFGYKTGYQIGQPEEKLRDVGCETCHGPGRQHVSNPTKQNIRGKVNAQVCVECHNEEHSPGFSKIASLLMREVDHSEKSSPIEGILSRQMRGPLKPQAELFVMSFCPFGVRAEQQLLPLIKEYGNQIDFTLRFIASEKKKESDEEMSESEPLEFTSLHGQAEVDEDIRQVVIAHYYPEKYIDYILCRADHLKKSWELCAQKFGVDVAKVRRITESDEGKRLFGENIQQGKALKISSSPTLVINGRKHRFSILKKVRGECQ